MVDLETMPTSFNHLPGGPDLSNAIARAVIDTRSGVPLGPKVWIDIQKDGLAPTITNLFKGTDEYFQPYMLQHVANQYFQPYIVQNITNQYFQPYIVQNVANQYLQS